MKVTVIKLLVFLFMNSALFGQFKVPIEAQPEIPQKSLPALYENIYIEKNIEHIGNDYAALDYSTVKGRTLKTDPPHIQVISRDETGTPQWFSATISSKNGKDLDSNISEWFESSAKMLGVDSRNSFRKKAEWADELGYFHIKYDQLHEGIKVFDGEIILHGQDRQVEKQTGKVVSSDHFPRNRSVNLSEQQAKAIIQAKIPGFKNKWNPLAKMGIGKDLRQWDGEMVYYKHEGIYKLAYNYVVFANMAARYEYLVDANTGEELDSWSKICDIAGHDHSHENCTHSAKINSNLPPPDGPAVATARDLLEVNRQINTYELGSNFFLLDGSRDMFRADLSELPEEPVGGIWTIDIGGQSPVNDNATFSQIVSNNNTWSSSPEGVSAHYNAGQAYEYFRTVHSRNGLTGDGQTIVSVVNVTDEDGSGLGNAFYNSLAIWYGNGDSTFKPLGRALDVAGHELSHGVVENTANLVYQNEPGAMNESFADIFGAMIDRDDWLIGEDVVKPGNFPGGALRSISDPHNNAQTGDFGRGWQPRHMNERFTGSQDNGGVHLNSGIPNYAFFLFASKVGKEIAEKVYYRALTTYLTRSSGFKELRYAVEQAANDLNGANVAAAASQAFVDVGIGAGTPSNFENDINANEGTNYLLASNYTNSLSDLEAMYVADLDNGGFIFNPLSPTNHRSKPSITDDGSRIIFVGTDNHVYLIDINWNANPPVSDERVISNEAIWRNAVISKDGSRVALLEVVRDQGDDNKVTIIDIASNTENEFEFKNPSYTQGVQTDDVLFADAMEFDITSSVLMYDAISEIKSTLGDNDISYWNIGFLEVWNKSSETWALGKIDVPLRLERNEDVGNPTYAKNSPYIIAFDVRTENNNSFKHQIYGMNTETNELNEIFLNDAWAYPNYSVDDELMVFNTKNSSGGIGIGILQLQSNKISSVASSASFLSEELVFGTMFTTGRRDLSDNEELLTSSVLTLSPVPSETYLDISLSGGDITGNLLLEVRSIDGKLQQSMQVSAAELLAYQLDISDIPIGSYVLSLKSENKIITKKFLKI